MIIILILNFLYIFFYINIIKNYYKNLNIKNNIIFIILKKNLKKCQNIMKLYIFIKEMVEMNILKKEKNQNKVLHIKLFMLKEEEEVKFIKELKEKEEV